MDDADIECALEEVGRDHAFAIANELGWRSGSPVPRFVWVQIIDLMRQTSPQARHRRPPGH